MAEEVSLKAGTGRTYQKCEELHGLAIYFERTGKYDDALDVCKQILLEPAAYEQPEKELIVNIFLLCEYLCERIDDEPQRRFFKKCENEYFKQILLNRSDFIKAKSDKEEDCKLLAQICEQENPELAITYLLKHRKGKTEKETEEFNEQLRRLMARSGANRYEENFRQHSVSAGNHAERDEGVKRRAPKILKKRGKERARSVNNVTFEIPQVSYSQEKSRRRKIKAALIVIWSLFVWFAVNAYPLPRNISHMLHEIKASLIALGMLVIINWRNDWWPNLGPEEVFVTKMKTL